MRILKASLICGVLAASFATLLFFLGAFTSLDQLLLGGKASVLWPQAVGAILLALGLAWTTLDVQQPALQAIVAAVAFVETIALAWVFHVFGIVWAPFTTITAGVLAIGFGLICSHSAYNLRKRLLEGMLGGRVSRSTFRRLLDSKKPLAFHGQRLEISVVVCSLSNRQVLVKTLSPVVYLEFLNAFLQIGAEALKASGGTLDGGNRELLRAVFGAPMAEEDHAAQAGQAAEALRQQLDGFCLECALRWKLTPEYEIGVASGEAIAGEGGPGNLYHLLEFHETH